MEKAYKKVFLVINLSYFGDVLLTNSLCQNIKLNYPDSKIVFLVNKPFEEAAKYQKDVDEVLVFDKNGEHKGLFGLFRFVKNCKYKNNIYASFIIYGNDRGILLSYLLNAKKRVAGFESNLKFLLTDLFYHDKQVYVQDINSGFISVLTNKKAEIVPIRYNSNVDDDFCKQFYNQYKNNEIIGLCCVSKQKAKDMPLETAAKIIQMANDDNKTVLLFGAGSECRVFADALKKRGCLNFVDLTNVTTISQLAWIMNMCQSVISVDTGTMHLACAVGVPVTAVFYKPETTKQWAPRENLYKSVVVCDDYSAENIYKKSQMILRNDKILVEF